MKNTAPNPEKLDQLREAIASALAEALKPGFHGKLTFCFEVRDGTMQRIDRTVTEFGVRKRKKQ